MNLTTLASPNRSYRRAIIIRRFQLITNNLLLKLTDRAPERVAAVKKSLLGMKEKVPTIVDARIEDEVRSGDVDYHLALITTFQSFADMQIYLDHPAHDEAVNAIKESLSAAASLCYES
jgi:hypothetical protein